MRKGVTMTPFYELFGRPAKELSDREQLATAPKVLDYLVDRGCTCIELFEESEKLSMLGEVISEYRAGISFTQHFWRADVSAYRDETKRLAAVKTLNRHIDCCSALGIETIVVHPPFYNPQRPGFHTEEHVKHALSRENAFEAFVSYFKEGADYALARNVKLGLENMPARDEEFKPFPLFGITINDMIDLFSSIHSEGLFMIFDTGHANTCRYEIREDKLTEVNPPSYVVEFMEIFAEKIVHIHLHDNDGLSDQHNPIGKGNVPFNDLLRALERSNYAGTIIVERNLDNGSDALIFKDLARLPG